MADIVAALVHSLVVPALVVQLTAFALLSPAAPLTTVDAAMPESAGVLTAPNDTRFPFAPAKVPPLILVALVLTQSNLPVIGFSTNWQLGAAAAITLNNKTNVKCRTIFILAHLS